MTGTEQVLINDWCQQFPSHSIGTLQFGRDGYLYVSGGDGASFNNVDYGQFGANYAGDQANPCGDPPGAVGTALSPPGARAARCAARSSGGPTARQPQRLDPADRPRHRRGRARQPVLLLTDANARRIVAYGLRNPFRITLRPGTDELWIGDVGWGTWEEINRVVDRRHDAVELRLAVLRGSVTQPATRLRASTCARRCTHARLGDRAVLHVQPQRRVVSYTGCHTGGSSITGMAFYHGGSYPAAYNGALFFADHTRNCIWAMLAGTNGLPDPSRISRSWLDAPGVPPASGRPEDRPGGDSSTSTWRTAPSTASPTRPHQPPTAHGEPDRRSRPAVRQLRRHGSTDPDGGDGHLLLGFGRRRHLR